MELQLIQSKIYEVRGLKVIFDFDIANMYEVETKRLKEAVRRNINRFPPDFMFELSLEEWKNLRTQIATSSWGGSRYSPFAFTEQGVAMLSGLLNSDVAIEVNISIMRAFVAVRSYLMEHAAISREIEMLWNHVKILEAQSEENLKAVNDLSEDNQNTFDDIYIALTELANKKDLKDKPRNPIGYVQPKND